MKTSSVALFGILCAILVGCKDKTSGEATAGSAAPAVETKAAEAPPADDVPCEKVVEKLASFDSESGDAEKKLWTKACATMKPEMKKCLVAATSAEERDKCSSGDKPIE